MPRKTKKQNEPGLRNLEWVSGKGGKRAYELRSGDQTLGAIRWPKLFGSLAEAEFGQDRWTLKRAGFLRPRVNVRPAGAVEDSAVLELFFGSGGLLRTKPGRSFRWIHQGFWSHRFAFSDEQGSELIVMEPKFGLLRRRILVQVNDQASKIPELPLLLLLGGYVTMLMADDDSAAAVACCS